jgi:hypothetical protein
LRFIFPGHLQLDFFLTAHQGAALDKKTQRFHQISADLTVASEAVRIVDEVTSWNGGLAPDIVSVCLPIPTWKDTG